MKTQIPRYLDGFAKVYQLKSDGENYPQFELENTNINLAFQLLSISDTSRLEFESRGKKMTIKLRIPQWLGINPKHVLEIDGVKHQVYNAYHFINKQGFKESDVTLEEYHE